eukprot:g11803.t2
MTLSASHTGWVVSNVEYQHWKVNGLRSVGGDGISSVRPGGRRAGCGFAHSGEAKGHNEVGALLEPQGWFEADDDEWVGVTLSLTTRRASSLRFIAEIARTQEPAKVNETSTTEHALGRCMFCGLRFEQEDTGLIADWSAAESFELGDMDDKLLKETGEPDVIQLKPRRSMSKL